MSTHQNCHKIQTLSVYICWYLVRQRDFILRILSPPQYDDWNDEGESSATFRGSSELFTATLLLSRACPWILSQRATQTNSILFHCVADREIPEETICKPRKSNPNCAQQGAAADWWVDTVVLLHRMDKDAFVRMMLFNLSASCYIPLKEDRETAAYSVYYQHVRMWSYSMCWPWGDWST